MLPASHWRARYLASASFLVAFAFSFGALAQSGDAGKPDTAGAAEK